MPHRVSQSDIQVLGVGSANARTSQDDLQVLGVGAPKVRTSQSDLQVLGKGSPSARTSQSDLHVLGVGSPKSRVSQVCIQVFGYVTTIPPPVLSLGTVSSVTPCGGVVSIALTWTASDAVTYDVYRSTTSGSGYALIGSTAAMSYVDSPPDSFTTYYYVVTSAIGDRESVHSNEVNMGSPEQSMVTPDVTTGAISWFNDGADYNAGTYRICYVRGAYAYNPLGYAAGYGDTVNGNYSIENPTPLGKAAGFYITNGVGNEALAPGNTTNYASQADCEAGNAGQSVIYVHMGSGPIGVYLNDFPYWDNAVNGVGPTFTISIAGCSIEFSGSV